MTGLYDENHENGANETLEPLLQTEKDANLRLYARLRGGVSVEDWTRFNKQKSQIPQNRQDGEIYCYGPLVDEGTRNFYDSWDEPAWSSKSFETALSQIDGPDVRIRINSPGGDVSELSAIVMMMNDNSDKKYTTVNEGMAYSAASVVLAMGDERLLTELSETMIHNAVIVTIGNSAKMMQAAERLAGLDEVIRNVYSKQLGQDKDKIMRLMDEETYMNSERASEMGFGEILPAVNKSKNSTARNFGDISVDNLFNVNVMELLGHLSSPSF